MARRKQSTPGSSEVNAGQLRRRYRDLERKICLFDDGSQRVVSEHGVSISAIGAQLRREVEGIDDPAERLALAEAAYLSVYKRLPWKSK